MSAQRYSSPVARERMDNGLCSECGTPGDLHSTSIEFWTRGPGCDLLPRGVAERIEQHKADKVTAP